MRENSVKVKPEDGWGIIIQIFYVEVEQDGLDRMIKMRNTKIPKKALC